MPSGRYDVVSSLSNAQSRITFEKLWKGDGFSAKKKLDRIFVKRILKVGDVKDPHEHNESVDKNKCFSIALLQVHGVDV